jgi:hypothetical protein
VQCADKPDSRVAPHRGGATRCSARGAPLLIGQ